MSSNVSCKNAGTSYECGLGVRSVQNKIFERSTGFKKIPQYTNQ